MIFAVVNVIPVARGGLVDQPTLFPMAGGMGLMGEAGPEAVMPLQRTATVTWGSERRLCLQVIMKKHVSADVQQREERGPDGGVRVILDLVGAARLVAGHSPNRALGRQRTRSRPLLH